MNEDQAERVVEALENIGRTLSQLTGMLNALYSPDPTWVQRALRDQYRKYAAEDPA